MSQENAEILTRFVTEFNERGWDALRDFADPDIEFDEPPEQPGAGRFRGIEEVLAAASRWAEAWEGERATSERVIDLGDTMVVLTVQRLLGRDGIELEQRSGNVFTFRDGKVVRWAAYWTPQSALAAVGLRE